MGAETKANIVVWGAIIVIMFALVVIGKYRQTYFYDKNGSLATKGIFFKTTVDLTQYQKIGTSNELICSHADIYSRSAMHETITVCK